MTPFADAFSEAWRLIRTVDPDLVEIVRLSLGVSFTATAIASLIGIALGAALAVGRFPGRRLMIIVVSAFMGLPPVVVGLALYLLLSRVGPLGVLDLLYTPTAMVIAQVILVTPIIAAISRSVIADLHAEYDEMLRAMRASRAQIMGTLIRDARPALMTAALAGAGRALAEVGAVMIVGGNIDHATRVMTTAIALETSRGDLALALALGLILLVISFSLNAALLGLRGPGARPEEMRHA